MNLADKSRKEVGALGESVVAEYLKRRGMELVDRNVARKTGELDLIVQEGDTLHFVEVKTLLVDELPKSEAPHAGQSAPVDDYDPSVNLHESKIRKVARTAEWYVANVDWEGEWQVDGALVWLRRGDGLARVQYLPQIV